MKAICYLFIASLIYTGCNDTAITVKRKNADSTHRDSSAPVSKASQERDEYNEEEDIKNLIRDMSQLCNNPVTKDTIFIIGNDTVSLVVNHACTGDSFSLPAKYLEPIKLDRFMAHSLKSDIIVKKNGVRVLDKRIEKEDFGSLVEGDLEKYAVLFYTNIKRENDTVYIDYSLSVPLTDVGIGVRVSIQKDGSLRFGRN